MIEPTARTITVLGRELHVREWGDTQAPAIIAWHGLARTGSDMGELARAMAPRYRVICPDTIGRGLSQWSPDPDREYCLSFYVELAAGLIDALGVASTRWVGTSMGGAIGIKAAATLLRNRITHLVLNDIGPEIAASAVERIRSYAGQPPAFVTLSELEAYFRKIYRSYGWLSDREWKTLTETSMRRLPDGRVTTHYDPAMVRQFVVHPRDYDLWAEYDALELPTLCLRGAASDLLSPEVAARMRERGPRARVVEIAGCGHAPALNVPAQLDVIERFLR